MTHAETLLLLIMGTTLMAGGGVSMLVAWLSSPGLKGVGWFSASFAAATLGAGLQMVHGVRLVSVLVTDLALLSSFVLVHLAVLQLAQTSRARVWHGLALLGVQVAVDVLYLSGAAGARVRLASLGFLAAAQALTTVFTLWPLLKSELRTPVAYCIAVLLFFTSVDLLRSVFAAARLGTSATSQRLGSLAFFFFLVVELGLAFGFFWMTTARLTAQMEHIASTDPLTRVYNRRNFLKWCEKELLRSQRSSIPFSLLMVDLDHFKCINDNYGHQRGDDVLVATVERMQDSVRGIDVLCRWGGEEFAVLLPNASVEATRIVAERIRENIARMQVALDGSAQPDEAGSCLTASIGAATYRDLDDDIESMLQRADRALYSAKSAGRNQVLIGA